LVCEYLENISRDLLEKYQAVIRCYVRRRHGVYALYRRGKLYYVGLASNLRSRLANHLKDRHGDSWDRFSVYLTIGDSHLRELESIILRVVQPKGNKQKGRFPLAEDLRRRLKRDIHASQQMELVGLLGKPTKPKELKNGEADQTPAGRRPALAPYVTAPFKLRARHRGKTMRALVRRDGRIRFAGTVYDSPSLAGAAAVQRRSCNGWTFWQYERAPGDWVPIDEMRR
jgi:hypothetical protein